MYFIDGFRNSHFENPHFFITNELESSSQKFIIHSKNVLLENTKKKYLFEGRGKEGSLSGSGHP